MLTMLRPLPAMPYSGPIHLPCRPLPASPPPHEPSLPTHAVYPSGTPTSTLTRRPHTHRLRSSPSPDLPPVTEEEETELAPEEPVIPSKLKKRPRPAPLIPSRTYAKSSLPRIEILGNVGTPDRYPNKDECESITLSPSTLLARRRSETILDFPVPPSHAFSIPAKASPAAPADNSPTSSYISMTSSSSTSSSSPPLTPPHSEVDGSDMQPHPEKLDLVEMTTEGWLNERSPRQPHRSASVVSLRSFNTAEFDSQVEGIYALLQPRGAVAQSPHVSRENWVAPTPSPELSPHRVLSVLDTAHGGSFDVPVMFGSFLSLPSSPASSHSPLAGVDDYESDGDGIPISFSDPEDDDFGPAVSSSEDDDSDYEGTSHCLDPEFYPSTRRRRLSRNDRPNAVLSSLSTAEPSDVPDTPSVYSMASPVDWDDGRSPPREPLVPSDVARESFASPGPSPPTSSALPPRPLSPCRSRADSPVLRSRFSTSTLGSLPPQSSSSTQALFARLTGRTKAPSPSKSERSPGSRRVSQRRHITPASPAPSSFSFSTHSSRSSLDSTSADSSSFVSDSSTSSSGLRRPPIPIELFLRSCS